MNIKIQPLRILPGWKMVINNFMEIEPSQLRDDDELWLDFFTQDLLYMVYEAGDIKIDLGWYPDTEPTGSFKLNIIKDDDWINPVESFESISKSEVVEKIEYYIDKYS